MKAIIIQRLLASIFLGLGGWALLFPGTVESLVFKPDYYMGTAASKLLIGCFGAQAVLAATVMFLTRFDARAFLIFGIVGSVPFFVFNYYFVFVVEMFTNWMLLDFAGNAGILVLCLLGYWELSNSPETLREGEDDV